MCRHGRVIADVRALRDDRIVSDEVSTGGTDEFLDTQIKEMDYVLKKIGLVAVATIGLSLAATPAFASPATPKDDPDPGFSTAYWTFIQGGEDVGRGAAELVAGAYLGIATTPALIAHSFTCGGCHHG